MTLLMCLLDEREPCKKKKKQGKVEEVANIDFNEYVRFKKGSGFEYVLARRHFNVFGGDL